MLDFWTFVSAFQATDVAARGLDIAGVENVVHFQAGRTVEVFVHRAGRTARAQAAGYSLSFVAPSEQVTLVR